MPRVSKYSKEKEQFLKDCKKLLKAALIIDIFICSKNRATPVQDEPEFKASIELKHTVARYGGCINRSSYSFMEKERDWSKYNAATGTYGEKEVKRFRTPAIEIGLANLVATKLIKAASPKLVTRFKPEEIVFTQSTCTDEELDWARFVLEEFGVDLTKWHLDEKLYRLMFKRSRWVQIFDEMTAEIWIPQGEDVASHISNKMETDPKLTSDNMYWRRDHSGETRDKVIQLDSVFCNGKPVSVDLKGKQ